MPIQRQLQIDPLGRRCPDGPARACRRVAGFVIEDDRSAVGFVNVDAVDPAAEVNRQIFGAGDNDSLFRVAA